uniref:Uncharacterized protein n=1 Tax=Panagrolaimus davidi TaxID=227884 RepID=A0A914PW45_9BILA
MSEFKHQRIEKCTGAEIIFFNHSLFLHEIDKEHEYRYEKRFYRNFYEKIGNQTLFGSPRVIQFFGSSLPAENFLQLLSTHTKTLQISDGTFTPDLEFNDIIKKAPNLEILTIYGDGSNITYDKGWIANSLEYKNGKNMKHVAVKPDISTELDIENLVKFVNAKCAKDVRIDIQYVVEYEELKEKKKERFDGICENVKEYYAEVRKNSNLQIGFHQSEVERRFSFDKRKANKKPKASTRVVTKRKRV